MGDLFVGGALNPLLKVDEPRADKYGMRVRIDEPGDYDFAGTIDLGELFAMLPDPGIAQRIFGCADRNDLAANTKHRAIVDYPEFLERTSTTRDGIVGRIAQSNYLPGIQQQRQILALEGRLSAKGHAEKV